MGIILFISGSPAGNLNDGDALFGLDVVSDLTVLFSVSSSSVFVSFSCTHRQYPQSKLLRLLNTHKNKIN